MSVVQTESGDTSTKTVPQPGFFDELEEELEADLEQPVSLKTDIELEADEAQATSLDTTGDSPDEYAADLSELDEDAQVYKEYFDAKFREAGDTVRQMGVIDMIAGGIITLVVVAIVLNQLLTLSIVNNTTGPFSGLIDSVENIGSSALTLIVVGFLAAAAGVVLSMFRGRF